MRPFVIGSVAVHAVIAAWAFIMTPTVIAEPSRVLWPWLDALWVCLVLPSLASWAALEIAAALRGSARVLETRLHREGTGMMAGALGAAIGWALALGAIVMVSPRLADELVTSAGALAGAALVVVMLPRVRAGRCAGCGYDLGAITVRAGGVCPECGVGVMG